MKPFSATLLATALSSALFLHQLPLEAATETVVHSFGGGTDGAGPSADLVDVKGKLYGTTSSGGPHGGGTVFLLDPATGAETALYSFGGYSGDGQCPQGRLLAVNGTLYGTTNQGGGYNSGAIFALDLRYRSETLPYSFGGYEGDGLLPAAGLIAAKGVLYGTTQRGGSICSGQGCGTLFAFNPATAAEAVRHSFGGSADGAGPQAGLIAVGGVLYGTTYSGGAYCCGSVFSFDPVTGAEAVAHSFAGNGDGSGPEASLVRVKSELFGTTSLGGDYGDNGGGTVFLFAPKRGLGAVVYSFCKQQNCTDGNTPRGSLITFGGALYGTTEFGGAGTCTSGGCGTVFSIDATTGAETVMYSFAGGTDGAYPDSGLTDVNGTLYGTTNGGGAYGYGTVFAITP